jgi:hypothetical protein
LRDSDSARITAAFGLKHGKAVVGGDEGQGDVIGDPGHLSRTTPCDRAFRNCGASTRSRLPPPGVKIVGGKRAGVRRQRTCADVPSLFMVSQAAVQWL